jgi:hypothetical protein
MTISSGSAASANDVMNAFGSMFNDEAQLLFNADYIGFDARLDATGVPSLKNVFYSTFTTDDVDLNYGFLYDTTNDYYYTLDSTVIGANFVIVSATSLSGAIGMNNCLSVNIAAGKWIIYCTTGTDEVKRAQIYKTLFYGTNGGNPAILTFTGITSLKTSHVADVGKRAIKVMLTYSGIGAVTYTGTFADTTTNAACSSWSSLTAGAGSGNGIRWELASGNILNSVGESSSSDEIGTDLSADEANNPANCQIERVGSNNNTSGANVLILCAGAVSWVNTGFTVASNVDFYVDSSIPLFSASDTLANEGLNVTTLIFKDTAGSSVTNCIPVINSTIDATSSEVISVSANGGSNYTTATNAQIVRPTAGTGLWRRIVITRTDLSKQDKVTEQAIKYNFY